MAPRLTARTHSGAERLGWLILLAMQSLMAISGARMRIGNGHSFSKPLGSTRRLNFVLCPVQDLATLLTLAQPALD